MGSFFKKFYRLFISNDVQVYSTSLPEEYFRAINKLRKLKVPYSTQCVTGGRNAHILQYNVYVREEDYYKARQILSSEA